MRRSARMRSLEQSQAFHTAPVHSRCRRTNHNTPFPIMKIPFSLALLCTLATLPGCGGSDDPPAVDGTFLDAAVEGLDYVAGSAAKATTNAKGEFDCKKARPCAWPRRARARQRAVRHGGDAALAAGVAGDPGNLKADAVVNRLLALQGSTKTAILPTASSSRPRSRPRCRARARLRGRGQSFDIAFNTLAATLPSPYAPHRRCPPSPTGARAFREHAGRAGRDAGRRSRDANEAPAPSP